MQNAIVIYTANDSERLRYVLHHIFTERFGRSFQIVHELPSTGFFISYGQIMPGAINIPDAGLLWEKGVKEFRPQVGNWNNIPVLFAAEGYTLPFDIFSATFFLLSRYEEYYAFKPDKYDRYPAAESILFKSGWLERPLLDEWIHEFRKMLASQVELNATSFTYLPTYDIDIAYSYKHKGLGRTAGALLKDMAGARFANVTERLQVLLGTKPDPYNAFADMRALHATKQTRPLYFILAALRTTAYDKNIPPSRSAMRQVIKDIAEVATIGLHPSYYSDVRQGMWEEERQTLQDISGQSINISRQHYIKLHLPHTYESLLAKGITDDYSMGYGTHFGFRAGTGRSFLWYNLRNEQITTLRVHPFCFMDTTAKYEMKLSANAAFERLNKMTDLLKQTGSTLITILHNFSLGKAAEWEGWREEYEAFINRECKQI